MSLTGADNPSAPVTRRNGSILRLSGHALRGDTPGDTPVCGTIFRTLERC